MKPLVTPKRFKEIMKLNDQYNESNEYYGGIINAIMDGEDPQQFEYTPEEIDLYTETLWKKQGELAAELGFKRQALQTIFSNSTVERWAVYKHLKGYK